MLHHDLPDTKTRRRHPVPLWRDILVVLTVIVLIGVLLAHFGWFDAPKAIQFDGREIIRIYSHDFRAAVI